MKVASNWPTNAVKSFIFFSLLCNSLLAGYGDLQDNLPSRTERELLVMTNAVRMDPVGFRDKYIPSTSILLPENYPAVGPVWYNHILSKGARLHTIDMATDCGLTHSSCDGTPFSERVTSYYTSTNGIGENIAAGYSSGIQTVIQWLRDDISQNTPAADKSSSDGHRKNIMNSSYHEFGAGYAYSSKYSYRYFWTEDFGGNTGSVYKIPGGCHFSSPGATTTLSFAANYYDKSGAAPLKAEITIDNVNHPMILYLGKAAAGTYIYTMTKDNQSHCYYFVFTDSNGERIHYPETISLSTSTDSSCSNSAIKQFRYSREIKKELKSSSVQIYQINGKKLGPNSQLFENGILLYKVFNCNQNENLRKIYIE